MATRYIQTDFWSDRKIHDDSSIYDRYLMFYFMTNPHTNQTGCYEMPISTILYETGLNESEFKNIMKKLSELKLCDYDFNTQEVLIRNWYKYNWTKSIKVQTCIFNEVEKIKSKNFIDYIDSVCIPYSYNLDRVSGKKRKENKRKEKEINKESLFEILEKEFKRPLSPIEIEMVNSWEYDNKIIILAIKEAVLNQARSFKYIDKILYNWAKQGLKCENDVLQKLNKVNNNGAVQNCFYEEI